MKNLAAAFALVLAGCPSDESEGIFCNSSCCNSPNTQTTEVVMLDADEVAAYGGQDGHLSLEECQTACEELSYLTESITCEEHWATADGGQELTCGGTLVCEGRRPAGLNSVPVEARDAGQWFARAAHAEAASVCAFRRMRRELAAHGAPAELGEAALDAAKDEVRHARTMRRLAAARGAHPRRVEVSAVMPRSLVALAVENAVEGCVHEAWSAVVALHQARECENPDVAATLAEVAVDETRHAELAESVHRWALPRLTPAEQRCVEAARARAITALAEVRYPAFAGLPGPAQVHALHAGMVAHVWSGQASV